MSQPYTIPIGGTFLIQMKRMRDESTGDLLTSGTITYALKDSGGTSLGTGSITYVSPGEFSGTILNAVTSTLVDNTTYYLEITVNSGQDFRRIPLTATYRQLT